MIRYENRQRGLTMLELLVVLAIVAILVVAAIPSFNKMNAHIKMSTAAQAVVTDLRATQADAIRQGAPATLTYSATQQSFQDFCNANWCRAEDGAGTEHDSVTFNSSGYVADPATPPFTLKIRTCKAEDAVLVLVQRTGRIQTQLVSKAVWTLWGGC